MSTQNGKPEFVALAEEFVSLACSPTKNTKRLLELVDVLTGRVPVLGARVEVAYRERNIESLAKLELAIEAVASLRRGVELLLRQSVLDREIRTTVERLEPSLQGFNKALQRADEADVR